MGKVFACLLQKFKIRMDLITSVIILKISAGTSPKTKMNNLVSLLKRTVNVGSILLLSVTAPQSTHQLIPLFYHKLQKSWERTATLLNATAFMNVWL